MKRIVFYFLVLIFYLGQAQCPLDNLADDLINASDDFKALVNTDEGFKAWGLLNGEAPSLRTNLDELTNVSNNLADIEKAGGYLKWKDLANAGGKSKIIKKLDVLGDLTHAKKFLNSLDDVADAKLLSRIDKLTDTQLQKLDKVFENLKLSAGRKAEGKLNFVETKNIEGFGEVTVTYKNGFPDFTEFCPGKEYAFKPNKRLTGKSPKDMYSANEWIDNNPNIDKSRVETLSNGQIKIDGETYTWHHHEDGKTMFPVPSKIHNSRQKGFNHSGGKAIISRDLDLLDEALFKSPF